jgi:hypothetical protein
MDRRVVWAALVVAGCASEPTSGVRRGQYKIESSTCTFLDPASLSQLHQIEPGQLVFQTFMGPDIWSSVDSVILEPDDAGGLSGSAVNLRCNDACSDCMGFVEYQRDDVRVTSPSSIGLQLARATQPATGATCNADRALALAASAVTCSIEATYYGSERLSP